MKNRRFYALFTRNGVNFIVIAAHLCARDYNAHKRDRELKVNSKISHLQHINDLRKILHQNLNRNEEIDPKILDALDNNNVILIGDLNLHHPRENEMLEENGFNDLWLEKYSHWDGITWDPSRNRMINVMLPFDNRRMRLDRV